MDCVEENTLFHFHENPNPDCPVGKNIHNILDDKLRQVQEAMEKELMSLTMADVMKDLVPLIYKQVMRNISLKWAGRWHIVRHMRQRPVRLC